jgi:multiple sugar transport system permease protein
MRHRTIVFYAYISPWLLGFVFLTIVPVALSFYLSLTNYDGLNWGIWKFMGLGNYARAFADEGVRSSLSQTLKWVGLNVPMWAGLSFLLALILNQDVKGRGVFRTMYYLPSIIPITASVWVWRIFLDKNYGLLNALISVFRPGTAIPWLTTQALLGLTWIAVWGGLGWGMVVFLAGLQDVPDELVEAARIDGANSWQVFRHVTLPLMTPVIFFVVMTGVIGSFQQFELPLLLQPSPSRDLLEFYPPKSINFHMLNVWYESFKWSRYGYGTALVWLLFVIVVGLAVVLFRSQRYWVYTESSEEE